MKIKLARNLQSDSIVDGEGIRTVIWTQGCSHNCAGCHNPDTHNFNGGFSKNIDELKEEIKGLKLQDGITFSGGDPMFQVEACNEIAKFCKEINLNVWCYTGFTFEQLIIMSNINPLIKEFLTNIDVLIDGKFKIELKSYDL
ncbi:MAG TPA: anaerobic ribonucleoside-triphosphate reductase activating protein, partial [Tenericutes bacterium]|nr:anaerobic ribonucleoside-triphosphate reductase activating protein [Mycoplasmatota bacterium]